MLAFWQDTRSAFAWAQSAWTVWLGPKLPKPLPDDFT